LVRLVSASHFSGEERLWRIETQSPDIEITVNVLNRFEDGPGIQRETDGFQSKPWRAIRIKAHLHVVDFALEERRVRWNFQSSTQSDLNIVGRKDVRERPVLEQSQFGAAHLEGQLIR